MKKPVYLSVIVLLVFGCSEQPAEESKSEQLGKEIAGRIRAPIEETRAITEKVQKTREIPPME
jgi:hypothetical protein